jgi:prepilin peptidase CpaA
MDHVALLLLSVLPALVIAAGLRDLTTMTIPNWMSGLLILGYFPAALLVGLPMTTVGMSVGIALMALVIGAGMFALNWIGGGDAKLSAAVCLWLGVSGSGLFLLWTAVFGGLFCLALIMCRVRLRPLFIAGMPGWVDRLMEPKGDIPYGVAIAAGALAAFPSSALLNSFSSGL